VEDVVLGWHCRYVNMRDSGSARKALQHAIKEQQQEAGARSLLGLAALTQPPLPILSREEEQFNSNHTREGIKRRPQACGVSGGVRAKKGTGSRGETRTSVPPGHASRTRSLSCLQRAPRSYHSP
jgi:hypothetical protein